ncbi:MAG: hypothetical protein WA604_03625 [Candidatus Sulfotelmatobacter sp.]
MLTGVNQRQQDSDQKPEKIQRPNPQDAPHVKEAQVELSALFLLTEQELGDQVSAEEEEEVHTKSSGGGRARNQARERNTARRKISRVAAPQGVKDENGKESKKTKAIQLRTIETFALRTCIVPGFRRCGDGHSWAVEILASGRKLPCFVSAQGSFLTKQARSFAGT